MLALIVAISAAVLYVEAMPPPPDYALMTTLGTTASTPIPITSETVKSPLFKLRFKRQAGSPHGSGRYYGGNNYNNYPNNYNRPPNNAGTGLLGAIAAISDIFSDKKKQTWDMNTGMETHNKPGAMIPTASNNWGEGGYQPDMQPSYGPRPGMGGMGGGYNQPGYQPGYQPGFQPGYQPGYQPNMNSGMYGNQGYGPNPGMMGGNPGMMGPNAGMGNPGMMGPGMAGPNPGMMGPNAGMGNPGMMGSNPGMMGPGMAGPNPGMMGAGNPGMGMGMGGNPGMMQPGYGGGMMDPNAAMYYPGGRSGGKKTTTAMAPVVTPGSENGGDDAPQVIGDAPQVAGDVPQVIGEAPQGQTAVQTGQSSNYEEANVGGTNNGGTTVDQKDYQL